MRNAPNVKANRYRVRNGLMASSDSFGNNGAFMVPTSGTQTLGVIASDGTDESVPELLGWEHVSVSTINRCPTWEEMCAVKELFWRDDEVVFQLHPAKKDWINQHPHCLHLWRKRGEEPPLPPSIAVGWQDREGRS